MIDVREKLFSDISNKVFHAILKPERAGVLAGVSAAKKIADEIGLTQEWCREEGEQISGGVPVAHFWGSPLQIAKAEEALVGCIAKASGIATAAQNAVFIADGKLEIISGSWKKMPPETKYLVRNAISVGGASFRICTPPMIYLDKNFIRMFGSISRALDASSEIEGKKIVQIRGENQSIEEETREAIRKSADILMVDTGNVDDAVRCIEVCEKLGARKNVQIAFAGNVKILDIPHMASIGLDKLCIGKEIVDAQLLDMKFDVIEEKID